MRWLGMVGVLVSCVRPEAVLCNDGRVCPAETQCDVTHHACVKPSQLETCVGLDNDTNCSIESDDDGICDREVCLPAMCGDTYLREPELCDGNATIPADFDCTDLGFYEAGALTCNSVCGFDSSACRGYCGDGVVTDGFEICEDNAVAPTLSCVDFGYGAGVLGCNMCGPGIAACRRFDWERHDMPEVPRAIDGTADDDIFVVGGRPPAAPMGAPMVQHYNGEMWSAIDVTGCVAIGPLLGVWAIGPGEAIAVGQQGIVVRLTPTTCTQLPVPAQEFLWSVYASSATNIYVLGVSGVVRHFNGTAWSVAFTGPVGGKSLWGSGPNDVYALFDDSSLHHFDGNTWSPVTGLPALSSLAQVWGTSATDVYLGGVSPDLEAIIARKNGTQWDVLVDGAPVMTGTGTSIGYGHARTGKIATTGLRFDGPVLVVHDGRGWTAVTLPSTQLGPVWTAPSGRVFTFGADKRVYSLRELRIDRQLPVGSGAFLTVGAADTVFARADKLYRWNGSTWAADYFAAAYAGVGPNGELYAVDQGEGLLQHTDANGWEVIDAALDGSAIGVAGPDDVWIVGTTGELVHWKGSATSPDTFVFDDGQASPMPIWIWDVYVASPSSVFAVGERGYIGHWNGSTWSRLSASIADDVYVTKVRRRPAGGVYALAGGAIYECDTQTCTTLSLPVPVAAEDIYAAASDDLFVMTAQAILHFDGTHVSPISMGTQFPPTSLGGAGNSVIFADARGGVHQLLRMVSLPAP